MYRPQTISLIIPAYNEEAYIGDCLETAIKTAGRFLHEIIVIDNASNDHTAEVAQQYPGVRIVKETRRGVSFARQRGLEEATGEILAYIDADTRLPLDWILIATQTFQNRTDVVCLSGPYRYYDGSLFQRVILNLISRTVLPVGYGLFGHMLVGGNFVATKQSIIDAGGFDPSIDFFGEDTDLGRRLRYQGNVKFRRDFFLWSSARRYCAEGLFKANLVYLLNFLWVVLFHCPYSVSHADVRMIPPRVVRELWSQTKLSNSFSESFTNHKTDLNAHPIVHSARRIEYKHRRAH
jgi:glycosyltransferase involved in cell wall biosynthesis